MTRGNVGTRKEIFQDIEVIAPRPTSSPDNFTVEFFSNFHSVHTRVKE